MQQAVDVGDFPGHIGAEDVAQDVAFLLVELDEFDSQQPFALRHHFDLGIDVQNDGVEAQVDRGEQQAAGLERLDGLGR